MLKAPIIQFLFLVYGAFFAWKLLSQLPSPNGALPQTPQSGYAAFFPPSL